MYVSKIDYAPNFGINFVNKANCNKRFLDAFENSKLVKEIDKKYPEAVAKYIKVAEGDMADADVNFHSTFFIQLAKNKICKYSIDSHTSKGADSAMTSILNSKTLEELEADSAKKVDFSITSPVEISVVSKKSNPILEFLKRIFS